MKSLILMLACFLSLRALADGPPQPAPGTAPLTYTAMYNLWKNGKETTDQILLGKWVQVATAEINDVENKYESTGIKNEDGSIEKYVFQYRIVGKDDFSEDAGKSMLTVTLLNLGGTKYQQGPYVVDSRDPQFAQWAWDYLSSAWSKTNYFSISCHVLRVNSRKLICASFNHGRYLPSSNDIPTSFDGFLKVQ